MIKKVLIQLVLILISISGFQNLAVAASTDSNTVETEFPMENSPKESVNWGLKILYGTGKGLSHGDIFDRIHDDALDGGNRVSQLTGIGPFVTLNFDQHSVVLNSTYMKIRSRSQMGEFNLNHERTSIMIGLEANYHLGRFYLMGQLGSGFILTDDVRFKGDTGSQEIDTELRFMNISHNAFSEFGGGMHIDDFNLFIKLRSFGWGNLEKLISFDGHIIGGIAIEI